MHPETIKDLLRARAESAGCPVVGFGWLVILWDKDGQRYLRHTHSSGTRLDATRIRDEELETGEYERAWIVQKTKQDYTFRDFLDGVRRSSGPR